MHTKLGPLSKLMYQHRRRCGEENDTASPDVIPGKAVALSILMGSLVKKNKNMLLGLCKDETLQETASNNVMHQINDLLPKFVSDDLLFYQSELDCDVLDRVAEAYQKRTRPGSIISSPTGTGKTRIITAIELCVNPSSAEWLVKKIDALFPLCEDVTVRLDSPEYLAIVKERIGSVDKIPPPVFHILSSLRTPFRTLRQSLNKIIDNSIGPHSASITQFTLFASPTGLIQQSAAEIARFYDMVGLNAKDASIKRPVVITLGPTNAKSGHMARMANSPACGRRYSPEKALASIKNYKGEPLFSETTIKRVALTSKHNFIQDATDAFRREKKRAVGVAGFDGIGVATRNVLPCVLLDMVERIFTNYGFVEETRDASMSAVFRILSGKYATEYNQMLETEKTIRHYVFQTIRQTPENTATLGRQARNIYKLKCFDAVKNHTCFVLHSLPSLDDSKADLNAFLASVPHGKKLKSKGLFGPILENLYHTISSIYNNQELRDYLSSVQKLPRAESQKKSSIQNFGQSPLAFDSKANHGCHVSHRLIKILSSKAETFPQGIPVPTKDSDRVKFICHTLLFACVALLEFYSEHTLMVHHLSPYNIIEFPTIMNQSTIVDRTAISVLDCFRTGIVGDKQDSILLTDEVDFLRTRDTVAYRSMALLQPNFVTKIGTTATIINNNMAEFVNIMSVIGQSIMVGEDSLEEFLAVGKNSKTYDHVNRLLLKFEKPKMVNIMAFPGALNGLIGCITSMVVGGKLYRSQLSEREREVVKNIYTRDIHLHNTTFTDPHIHSRIQLFQNSFHKVFEMIPNVSPTASGKCYGGISYDTLKTQIASHLIINQLYSNAKKALGRRNNAERKIVYVPFRSRAEKEIYDALSEMFEKYIRRKDTQEGVTDEHQEVLNYPRMFYVCMLGFLRAFTESPAVACARLLAKTHFDPTGPYKQLSLETLKYNTADAFKDPEIMKKVYNPEFIPILRPMKTVEEILESSASTKHVFNPPDVGDADDDEDTLPAVGGDEEADDRSLKLLPFLPKEILHACHRYLQHAHSSSIAQADSANSDEMKNHSADAYHIGTKFVGLCDILQHLIREANREKRLVHSVVALNTKNAILTLYDLLLNTRSDKIRLIIWSTDSDSSQIKKELATTKCHCIILANSKLIARGFNLHEVDIIFDLDSEFNPVVSNQMAGRGLRLTNKDSKKRIIYISIQGTVEEAVNNLHQLKNASSDIITSNVIDISSTVSDAIKSIAAASTSSSQAPEEAEEEDDMEVEEVIPEYEVDTTSRSRERRLLSLKLDHAAAIKSDRKTDPDYRPNSASRKRKHADITIATEKTISAIGRLSRSASNGKKTTLASLLLRTRDKSEWTKEVASIPPYELYMTNSIDIDPSSGRFIYNGIDASQTGRAHNLLISTFLLDCVSDAKRQKTM